jgi:hypothetical protein
VTLSRVAAALVLGLVVGALPGFIPLVAHLHRVILSNPLEAAGSRWQWRAILFPEGSNEREKKRE